MAADGWAGRRVWWAPAQGFAARRRAALLPRLGAVEVPGMNAAEVVVAADPDVLRSAPAGAIRVLDACAAPVTEAGAADLVWTLTEGDEWALRHRLPVAAVAVPHLTKAQPRAPAPPDPALGLRIRIVAPEREAGWVLDVARPIWRAGLAPLAVLRPEGERDGPFTLPCGEAAADLALLPAEPDADAVADALASGLPLIAVAGALGHLRRHHPWQAAPDVAAAARGALAAAYDPATLAALARAAAATRRAAQLAVETGLARTATALTGRRSGM